MRSQREKCCVSLVSDAAKQQKNRSFMHAAAKINGRIHTVRTKQTLGFPPLLTQHFFAFAGMVVWRCSIFHRSGRSNGSTAPDLKLTFCWCGYCSRSICATIPPMLANSEGVELWHLGRQYIQPRFLLSRNAYRIHAPCIRFSDEGTQIHQREKVSFQRLLIFHKTSIWLGQSTLKASHWISFLYTDQ